MEEVLFKHKGKTITKKTLISALRNIGLKKGDDIFVHSDIGKIGKIGDIHNSEKLANIIIDCFLEVIYPGTMIVPTFSYDFPKKKDYNPKTSKSDVGALTNVFFERPDSIRSNHPIFSVSAIGDNAEYYIKINKNVCFGKDSFFDKIVKKNVKNIGFGVKLIHALTLLHHVEEMSQVPYRYYKKFEGNIIIGNDYENVCFDYYVRDLNLNPTLKLDMIETFLIKNKSLKSIQFGYSSIELVDSIRAYKLLSEQLENDPYWLVNIGESK